MKPFIHITMPAGQVYEIAASIIASNRAAAMQAMHPDEFPTPEAALEDTVGLFEDDFSVEDWARNNMNWSDLEPHVRLVRFTPPETDHVNDCEWSHHNAPAMLGELDGDSIMRQPVEMVLNTMAVSQQLCNVTVLNGANGEPYAAMALVIGNKHVVGAYLQALQLVGDSLTGGRPAPLTN